MEDSSSSRNKHKSTSSSSMDSSSSSSSSRKPRRTTIGVAQTLAKWKEINSTNPPRKLPAKGSKKGCMKGKGGPENSTCKFRGVRQRNSGKRVAEIRAPNKGGRMWLGTFASAVEAALAYDNAARVLYGSCARLNSPNSKSMDDYNSSQMMAAATSSCDSALTFCQDSEASSSTQPTKNDEANSVLATNEDDNIVFPDHNLMLELEGLLETMGQSNTQNTGYGMAQTGFDEPQTWINNTNDDMMFNPEDLLETISQSNGMGQTGFDEPGVSNEAQSDNQQDTYGAGGHFGFGFSMPEEHVMDQDMGWSDPEQMNS